MSTNPTLLQPINAGLAVSGITLLSLFALFTSCLRRRRHEPPSDAERPEENMAQTYHSARANQPGPTLTMPVEHPNLVPRTLPVHPTVLLPPPAVKLDNPILADFCSPVRQANLTDARTSLEPLVLPAHIPPLARPPPSVSSLAALASFNFSRQDNLASSSSTQVAAFSPPGIPSFSAPADVQDPTISVYSPKPSSGRISRPETQASLKLGPESPQGGHASPPIRVLVDGPESKKTAAEDAHGDAHRSPDLKSVPSDLLKALGMGPNSTSRPPSSCGGGPAAQLAPGRMPSSSSSSSALSRPRADASQNTFGIAFSSASEMDLQHLASESRQAERLALASSASFMSISSVASARSDGASSPGELAQAPSVASRPSALSAGSSEDSDFQSGSLRNKVSLAIFGDGALDLGAVPAYDVDLKPRPDTYSYEAWLSNVPLPTAVVVDKVLRARGSRAELGGGEERRERTTTFGYASYERSLSKRLREAASREELGSDGLTSDSSAPGGIEQIGSSQSSFGEPLPDAVSDSVLFSAGSTSGSDTNTGSMDAAGTDPGRSDSRPAPDVRALLPLPLREAQDGPTSSKEPLDKRAQDTAKPSAQGKENAKPEVVSSKSPASTSSSPDLQRFAASLDAASVLMDLDMALTPLLPGVDFGSARQLANVRPSSACYPSPSVSLARVKHLSQGRARSMGRGEMEFDMSLLDLGFDLSLALQGMPSGSFEEEE